MLIFPKSLSAMETWAGFCPILHLSLAIWLVIAAQAPQNTKAEITCASCVSPVQLHRDKLQPLTRTPRAEEVDTLQNTRVEFRELGFTQQNTGVDVEYGTGDSVEAPQFLYYANLDKVHTSETSPRSSRESRRSIDEPEKGEDGANRRAKRSVSGFAEFGDASALEEDRGSVFDGHRQGRSDSRWNREDGRANKRQDEQKLISNTFALTGDSAHNHAVVYWSGQNSSVSNLGFRFCFFQHFNSAMAHSLHEHTESALCRCAWAVNRCTGIYRCAPARQAP